MTHAAPAAPPAYPVQPARPARSGLGPLRHLASLVLALVVTPLGIVFVDLGNTDGLRRVEAFADLVPVGAVVELAAGGFLLLVAAACGRLSGLGPLIAAVVWGLAPLLWALISYRTFFRTASHLPGFREHLYFTTDPWALFAVVGAMLLGVAVSGRWR